MGLGERGEEAQLSAQRLKQTEIVGVDKGKSGIAGDCDALSGKQRRQGRLFERGCKDDGRWQVRQRGIANQIRRSIEPLFQVGDLFSLNQSQMTARQGRPGKTRDGTQIRHRVDNAGLDHLSMPCAGHLIGDHAGETQCRAVGRQPQRECTEGLAHAARIDQRHHRDIESLGQIGTGRCAIEQPHRALDQNQISLGGCSVELAPTIGLADHPQIERCDLGPAGAAEDHRIEKIRAGFKHPHPSTESPVITRQRGDQSGLALPGGAGGQKKRWALAWGLDRVESAFGHEALSSMNGLVQVAIGIGCRRGVSLATLEEAIDTSVRPLGMIEVRCLASHARKASEPGLIAFAKARGWPLAFYCTEALAAVAVPNASADVAAEMGTASVAEAAALLAAGATELLIEKQRYGDVTVAVARWLASGVTETDDSQDHGKI